MKYKLSIHEHNKQCHLDVEKDIKERKNGLFTFTLRINAGNIVDYNVTEYVDARQKYLSLKRIIVSESSVSYNYGKRSKTNPLWANYIQRGVKERKDFVRNS